MDTAARRALLRWYRRHKRDLPWRRTTDPYAIWVSEVMLQQTRVDVATSYYERWMARFPTVASLAAASEEEVLQSWSGLGYYSRARNLHKAAKAVVDDHGGNVPGTFDGLRALPGVGSYTAGAIASIAFGKAVPAVDGNVVRVACRIAGIRDPSKPAARRRIEAVAASWVPARGAGDWNQAVMELGATVCTPKAPRCESCPVANACEARRLGIAQRIPVARRRTKPKVERMHFAAVVESGKILLVRNPPGLLGGLWSLPGGAGTERLASLVQRQAGVAVRLSGKARHAEHQFSHRTWRMEVRKGHRRRTGTDSGPPERETSWLPLGDLDGAALSNAMRTALRSAGIGKVPGKAHDEA